MALPTIKQKGLDVRLVAGGAGSWFVSNVEHQVAASFERKQDLRKIFKEHSRIITILCPSWLCASAFDELSRTFGVVVEEMQDVFPLVIFSSQGSRNETYKGHGRWTPT